MMNMDVVGVFVVGATVLSAVSTYASMATRAAVAELKAEVFTRVAEQGKETAEHYRDRDACDDRRSEEHTSELQSH